MVKGGKSNFLKTSGNIYICRISDISFDLMISDQVQAAVPKDTLLIRDKNRLKQVNKFLITVDTAFK